ncbi:hypothetical protein HMPREF0972_02472 [Actinomyces sp. oral taxon 848 str. F0332]|nr:hypothetical protein HMPREF0972_02472 [Actinomyces sp. oral taxon 848 str. F0332]
MWASPTRAEEEEAPLSPLLEDSDLPRSNAPSACSRRAPRPNPSGPGARRARRGAAPAVAPQKREWSPCFREAARGPWRHGTFPEKRAARASRPTLSSGLRRTAQRCPPRPSSPRLSPEST